MKKIFLLIVPMLMYGENLKSLLEYATQNSDLLKEKTLAQKAKSIELESKKSAYYPTIDVGGFYQSLNEKTPMMAGDIYSAYAKLSFDIYDGGKKSALESQSANEYDSAKYESEAMKKSLGLKIVQDFYTIKSLQKALESQEDANRSLKEQLTRVSRFYAAKVATKDDVDRLQSAYDTNVYEIETLKFQILSLKKSLELNVGKNIETLDDSKFITFEDKSLELSDSIKSLSLKKDALLSGSESLQSVYYPQIKIEDTLSLNGYARTDSSHPEGVDIQNKILLSLNMRIYDNATVDKAKEAILINAQALDTKVNYAKNEQKMQYDLAMLRIDTAEIKIKSAKSALVAANSAFETISKKYDARIVDNVVYLDALTSQTKAKALYATSLNDLEIAYAIYYYYAGKNIEEFVQ